MRDYVADCHASGTVRTAAFAINEMRELALCGHCVGRNRQALTDAGWIIVPFGQLATTPGVGTEATGQHYALEAP